MWTTAANAKSAGAGQRKPHMYAWRRRANHDHCEARGSTFAHSMLQVRYVVVDLWIDRLCAQPVNSRPV